jgi:hypothetical protein
MLHRIARRWALSVYGVDSAECYQWESDAGIARQFSVIASGATSV